MTAEAIIENAVETKKSGLPGVTILKPPVSLFHRPSEKLVLVETVGQTGENKDKAFVRDLGWTPVSELETPVGFLPESLEAHTVN